MEEKPQQPEITEQEIAEVIEEDISTWYDYMACLRSNVSSGLEILGAMDVMDENSPFIIENRLQKKAAKAKKQALEILFKNIDLLHDECFREEGD